MARRKKISPRLPRVTVLAYSRRDLERFAESVDKLVCLVNDLAMLVPHLRGVTKPRKSRGEPQSPIPNVPARRAAEPTRPAPKGDTT